MVKPSCFLNQYRVSSNYNRSCRFLESRQKQPRSYCLIYNRLCSTSCMLGKLGGKPAEFLHHPHVEKKICYKSVTDRKRPDNPKSSVCTFNFLKKILFLLRATVRKNCSSDREKLFEITRSNSERSELFLVTECFFLT